MQNGIKFLSLIGAVALSAQPALGKWSEVAAAKPVAVAKSAMKVTAPAGWNMSSSRPIKKGEIWSFDGPILNRIEFVAAISPGEPIAYEIDRKRKPLPKFNAAMLPTDVVQLYEQTVRLSEGSADFTVDEVAPSPFAGKSGFSMKFHYSRPDEELVRKGEARGAIVGGKLYLISFTAPALHYFDRDIAKVRTLMDSVTL